MPCACKNGGGLEVFFKLAEKAGFFCMRTRRLLQNGLLKGLIGAWEREIHAHSPGRASTQGIFTAHHI